MADNIVGGLFGIDPSALQQQRMTQDLKEGYMLAQLDPLDRASAGMYAGAKQLGRAAQGLFGVEDPQMSAAKEAQQLMGQFDPSTSAGLKGLTAALLQRAKETNNPVLGQMAQQAGQQYQKTVLNEATVTAKTREQLPTIAKLQAYRANLISQFGPDDPRVSEVNAEIKQMGESKASKTVVDLSGLAGIFAKEEAKASAKDVTEQISKAQDQLKTNSKLSRDIAELEKIIPNSFQGQLSDIAKTSSKTLSALGIPVGEKASNTEVANALFNNFVLPAVKQLPGSLAAKELAFLQQSKPNSLQEPATINRLIKMVKEDIAANRALVKRADAYQKQDKLGSLQGFNLALQSDDIYTNLNKYNALKARVQAKQPITKEDAEFAKSVEQELGL